MPGLALGERWLYPRFENRETWGTDVLKGW